MVITSIEWSLERSSDPDPAFEEKVMFQIPVVSVRRFADNLSSLMTSPLPMPFISGFTSLSFKPHPISDNSSRLQGFVGINMSDSPSILFKASVPESLMPSSVREEILKKSGRIAIFATACISGHVFPGEPTDSATFDAFSSPEPTILLACGRNRELWEQSFQACARDADAQ